MKRTIGQLVIVLCFSSTLSVKYSSKFCHNNNLNCTLDDRENINSSCQIMYPDCRNFEFKNQISTPLHDVSINLYQFVIFGINITSFNANWTDINFRISKINHSYKFCRTIHKPLREKTFYYDCDWLTSANEDYYFEYETLLIPHSYISTYKKFIFKIPGTVETPRLFSYINITELPIISLHWNLVKNITFDHFLLKIYKSNELIEEYNVSSFNFYFKLKTHGNYKFNISIISQECLNCFEIPLPSIEYYPDYYFSTFLFDSPIYLILIFGIFLIFILVLLNYKTIFSTNKSEIIYPYPKILLIYKSTDNLHNRLVESFAKLLKNDYSINVILDIFDIPSSPQKDPFLWCKEVLKNVDFVIFIISPPGKEIGVYRNLYSLVLKLYEEQFVFLKKIKFINVTFPYCNSSMIPEQINHLSTFKVNDNVNNLIAFLKNNGYYFNTRLSSLLWLFKSKIRTDSHYLEEYKKILNQSKYHTWNINEDKITPQICTTPQKFIPSKSEIPPSRNKYDKHEYKNNLDEIDLNSENHKIPEIEPLKSYGNLDNLLL